MDICKVLPENLLKTIEDILFEKNNLTSAEKAKMYVVSKNRMDSCFNERCARIIRIYNIVKATLTISKADIKFIKKQVNYIVHNEIDIPANEDETSEEYKDYCYNLCFNFAFHKLYVSYFVIEHGKKTEKDGYYEYAIEDKIYKKRALEVHTKLKYLNAPCNLPDVHNLPDLIKFIEKLSLKQKTWVGL
jgi:hypothetical protein